MKHVKPLSKTGNKDHLFSLWTKKYSLSKSLRFGLKPIGKTADFLNEFITSDTQRDKDYKKLKKIIDEFHKAHIEEVFLSIGNLFKKEDLEEFDFLLKNLKKLQIKNPPALKSFVTKQRQKFKTLDDQADETSSSDTWDKQAVKKKAEKPQDFEKALKALQKKLRKQVGGHFKARQIALKERFSKKPSKKPGDSKQGDLEGKARSKDKSPLFEKALITEILPEWLKGLSYKNISHREDIKSERDFSKWREKSLQTVKKFEKFTVYLKAFHKNRKNIYSDKEQATAVSYRIVHENLPKFLTNGISYQKIKARFPELKNQIDDIKTDFQKEFDHFGISCFQDLFKPEFFNKTLSQKGIDTYNCIIGGKILKGGTKSQGINEKINLFRQQQEKPLESKNTQKAVIKTRSKNKNIPFLQPLYKQILSDRQSHSFYYEEFKNKEELSEALAAFWKTVSFEKPKRAQGEGFTGSVIQEINQIFAQELSKGAFELDKIYFEAEKLNGLSHKLFGDWNVIKPAFETYAENAVNLENQKLFSSKSKRDKWLKKSFFSFKEIHTALFSSHNLEREIQLSPSCLLYPLLIYAGGKTYKKTDRTQDSKTKVLSLNEKNLFSLGDIQKALNKYAEKSGFPSEDPALEAGGNILSFYFRFSLLSFVSYKKEGDLRILSDGIFKDDRILKAVKKLPDTQGAPYSSNKNPGSSSHPSACVDQSMTDSSHKKEHNNHKSGAAQSFVKQKGNEADNLFQNHKHVDFKKICQALYNEKDNSFEKFFETVIKTSKHTKKPYSLDGYMRRLYQEIDSLPQDEKLDFSQEKTTAVQGFLYAFMDMFHLLRPLKGEKAAKSGSGLDLLQQDTGFYNKMNSLYESLHPVIPLFNKCRNFISQNKSHLKKIKINFENAEFLDGWDVNKETAYRSVLLRKKAPSAHLTDQSFKGDGDFFKKEKQKGRGNPSQNAASHRKDQAVLPSTHTEEEQYIYYLGVMRKDNKDMFDYHLNFNDSQKSNKDQIENKKQELKSDILCSGNKDHYEKMNYKLLPDPDKMLPKVFFSPKNQSNFKPSDEILRIRQQKTYLKNDGKGFKLLDCRKLIDFYKQSIQKHTDWKKFSFNFSNTESYKDISWFYHEVASQGYKLFFDKIKSGYIDGQVKKGRLYLFQIYNKDFSLKKKTKGRDNLHTSYFKLLFDKENLKDTVFKLSGGAEMFFRKASLEKKIKKITHPAGHPVKNKNPLNPKKSSAFHYDIIKDRRFTEDKFFLHIPITLNFKQGNMKAGAFNQEVLKHLKDNKKFNIIGIDRGERHLAYYTVINQERKILSQGSFNTVEYKGGKEGDIFVKKDYHALLEKREGQRARARKLWNKIKGIKDLKSGFLSHLVHKISYLMIEHNAVLVFEDLNKDFKRGRAKFEKQIYQKLEKALIDKLNHLVFKGGDIKKPGGFLNGFQLSAPFESFQKMGKQTGFIFYVPPYYTSKADPLTGFVNLIYPKYENIEKSKGFFEKFEKIYFDCKNGYFVFEYRDGKVNPRRKLESNHFWAVCSQSSDRYRYIRKSKKHKKINITEELKKLFDGKNIDYAKGQNLKREITKQNDKGFFLSLMKSLNLILQLRYINPEAEDPNEKDFILSPVAGPNGRFFDSRKASLEEPENADANGAYHIALKGLKMLQSIGIQEKDAGHIKNSIEKNSDKKIKRFLIHPVANKDWFSFIRKDNPPS